MQVMDMEVDDPHAYLENVGTLHASLEDAKTTLSIALMREARNTGRLKFDII